MWTVKQSIKADNGKLSRVLRYQSGTKVEIPINKDGSIRWYPDKPKQASK